MVAQADDLQARRVAAEPVNSRGVADVRTSGRKPTPPGSPRSRIAIRAYPDLPDDIRQSIERKYDIPRTGTGIYALAALGLSDQNAPPIAVAPTPCPDRQLNQIKRCRDSEHDLPTI